MIPITSEEKLQHTSTNRRVMPIPLVGESAHGVTDLFGRIINYLRVSLTDMCNLRCVYCMPADMEFRPPNDLMQDEELLRIIHIFARAGFTKIRYTGGEPTLRKNFPDIVSQVREMQGIKLQVMTTNGILLQRLAPHLKSAGMQRVNISLDTIDAKKYKVMTRWGNLKNVFEGIEAAKTAGLEIKLNCVVVRGFNDTSDVVDLANLTLTNPWQVRFIEVMPFGKIDSFQRGHVVPEDELRSTISASLGPMHIENGGKLDGEARVYKLGDAVGSLGFISSVTKPFCGGCNRARLTPDGKLRLCLLRDKEFDVLSLLRAGASDQELLAGIIGSVRKKPWGHDLERGEYATNRVMSDIGG